MYTDKNITRKTNLKKNDSLSAYEGMTCQQNPYCFEAFFELLKNKKPNRILEIGTALGGLTSYINAMCKNLGLDTQIRTYDRLGRHEYKKMKSDGIDVRIENIFLDGYKGLANHEVKDFIRSAGSTIVLCDGGNKIAEFNILSEFLKSGDIILAHDYAFDNSTFESSIKNKYWNWHEISEADILPSVQKYNLKPYMKEVFEKAVWVCKIK
jgi:cephalosporin hydroxylase